MVQSRDALLPVARRHALIAALASVGYVALVAIRRAPVVNAWVIPVTVAALALGWLSARVRVRTLAWACWGAGIVAAASIEASPATRIAAAIGALVASAAAAYGLTRIASLGGIVRDRNRSPWIGFALLGAVWLPASIALCADLVRTAGSDTPFTGLMVTSAAGLSVLALVGLGAAARLERQLELGVSERLNAFLLGACALATLALLAVVSAAMTPALAACAAAALVGVTACVTAELGDPVALWHGAKRATALAGFAAALAAVFAFLVVDQPGRERGLVVVLALVALVVGAELPRIARAVRGNASRRLTAAALASRALRGRDADLAVTSALRALASAAAPPKVATQARSAELWTLDPVRVLRVDTAGYPTETPGELPPELLVIACGEPEATIRAEALAAVEIRRPDLRALSRWMSDAKMATATLVTRGGDIEGVLFLPTYDGIPDLTLEEARSLRDLADELAPLCHARAKLTRSMLREQAARKEADQAITHAERLDHQLARAAAHHGLAAARLARPAAVGIYAARSRAAYEALERLTKAQAPIAVVAPSGVDPVPFLARAHLAGSRSRAPLVLVDGTSTREHDLERWRDPVASPLELADGGALVLLDCAALPIEVQRLVGQSLAERRAPWGERPEALDIVLVITTVASTRELADSGRLDPLLASRLGAAIDEPVHLPGIADRPEDIRALLTDRLAREGLRVRGAPVGIEDAAFAVLVDHPFEGEDAELTSIVQRLVARTKGDVVREADVRAVLGPTTAGAEGSEGRPSSLSPVRRA